MFTLATLERVVSVWVEDMVTSILFYFLFFSFSRNDHFKGWETENFQIKEVPVINASCEVIRGLKNCNKKSCLKIETFLFLLSWTCFNPVFLIIIAHKYFPKIGAYYYREISSGFYFPIFFRHFLPIFPYYSHILSNLFYPPGSGSSCWFFPFHFCVLYFLRYPLFSFECHFYFIHPKFQSYAYN